MKIMKQHMAAVVTGMVVVTLAAGTAHARMHGKMMDKDNETSEKTEMKKGMPMMQGGMMKREVVPSGDGGVIVVIGDMMLKYDKNLELVKKATIEISDKDMEQMMQKMKQKCPMCRKMMKEKTEKED